MRLLLTLLVLIAQPVISQEREGSEVLRSVLREQIFQSKAIVDVCIYKQSWVGPKTKGPPHKGVLTYYAVVTAVHKGAIEVGTKVEFESLIEDAPSFFSDFTATVEGELMVLLFTPAKEDLVNGVYRLGDLPFRFEFGTDFHKLLVSEKRTDPGLKGTLHED
jgi:hypothetical protein